MEKITETDDLFEYSLDNQKNNSDSPGQNDEYAKLLSLISSSGEDIDELIRAMNLPTEKVLTLLLLHPMVKMLYRRRFSLLKFTLEKTL